MNLFLRFFYVLVSGLFRKRLQVTEDSTLKLMVMPNDLDLYGHMNNGRYLTLMDLGRIDWILRSGLGRTSQKKRWNPIVGVVKITYKKSFFLFQTFELHTRILGWDKKWFYLEQVFKRQGNVYAVGLVKGLFRGPKGSVSPAEVLDGIGIRQASPELSEAVINRMISEER